MDCDVVIIGAGPGGYSAALTAATLGRHVTLIEKEDVGGTCLNYGCMPTKALLKSANVYEEIKKADSLGLKVDAASFDFAAVIERSRKVVENLRKGALFMLQKKGVEVIKGEAKLTVENEVIVNDEKFSYKDLIINIGAHARLLPDYVPDGVRFHTARTILEAKEFPKKLLVIGGGAIGLEFAYFFSTLGSEVTIIEMAPQLLPLEDIDIATDLQRYLKRRGITVKTGAKLTKITKSDAAVHAEYEINGTSEVWEGSSSLLSIGVVPNTIPESSLKTERGFIVVNEKMETGTPHIYAVGDVVGHQLLAHKAEKEGEVAALNICGKDATMSYDLIPAVTYCNPQVASVGENEKKLKAEGRAYKVRKLPFLSVGKAQTAGETEGFIKLISEEEGEKLLGVQVINSHAADIVAEGCALLRSGATISDVREIMHAHPTLAEGLHIAASLD